LFSIQISSPQRVKDSKLIIFGNRAGWAPEMEIGAVFGDGVEFRPTVVEGVVGSTVVLLVGVILAIDRGVLMVIPPTAGSAKLLVRQNSREGKTGFAARKNRLEFRL
jgi:hypothetical protein